MFASAHIRSYSATPKLHASVPLCTAMCACGCARVIRWNFNQEKTKPNCNTPHPPPKHMKYILHATKLTTVWSPEGCRHLQTKMCSRNSYLFVACTLAHHANITHVSIRPVRYQNRKKGLAIGHQIPKKQSGPNTLQTFAEQKRSQLRVNFLQDENV